MTYDGPPLRRRPASFLTCYSLLRPQHCEQIRCHCDAHVARAYPLRILLDIERIDAHRGTRDRSPRTERRTVVRRHDIGQIARRVIVAQASPRRAVDQKQRRIGSAQRLRYPLGGQIVRNRYRLGLIHRHGERCGRMPQRIFAAERDSVARRDSRLLEEYMEPAYLAHQIGKEPPRPRTVRRNGFVPIIPHGAFHRKTIHGDTLFFASSGFVIPRTAFVSTRISQLATECGKQSDPRRPQVPESRNTGRKTEIRGGMQRSNRIRPRLKTRYFDIARDVGSSPPPHAADCCSPEARAILPPTANRVLLEPRMFADFSAAPRDEKPKKSITLARNI